MALTLQRWLLAAVLACAAIAIWLLPDTDGGSSSASRVASAIVRPLVYNTRGYWALDDRLHRLNDKVRVLEIRDSVLTPAVRSQAGRNTFTVLTDRRLPESLGVMVEQAIRGRAKALDMGSRAPVIVAVVLDTERTPHGLPRYQGEVASVDVFLPEGSPTSPCVALVRLRVDMRNSNARFRQVLAEGVSSQATAQSALGQCALYATFGAPGPQIGRWLRTTGWQSAQVLDWRTTADPWHDPNLYRGQAFEYRSLFDLFGMYGGSWWVTRSVLSADAVACIAGERPRCGAALIEAPSSDPDTAWSAHVVDVNASVFGNWRAGLRSGLGPQGGWVVSDLIHDMGRERFAQFWTSTLPPDSAYRAVTREDLSAWAERWATRVYGAETLGPRVPANAPIAGFVTVLLALGVAMGFARERRVT